VAGVVGHRDEVSLKGVNPCQARAHDGIRTRFPDAMFKDDGPIQWSGSITLRNLTAADYDALLNATGFAVKLRFKSTVVIGATSYAYSFWFEALNAQYVGGGPEPIGNKRIHGASFDWEASYSGVAGSTTRDLPRVLFTSGSGAGWCADCSRAHKRKLTPEQNRERNLKSLYGITVEQYDEMEAAQAGLCAICRQPEVVVDYRSGDLQRLAVDHCHDTGDIRALLCAKCNKGLGCFGHDIEQMRLAITYLEKHMDRSHG
jgi:hypothetical protein